MNVIVLSSTHKIMTPSGHMIYPRSTPCIKIYATVQQILSLFSVFHWMLMPNSVSDGSEVGEQNHRVAGARDVGLTNPLCSCSHHHHNIVAQTAVRLNARQWSGLCQPGDATPTAGMVTTDSLCIPRSATLKATVNFVPIQVISEFISSSV